MPAAHWLTKCDIGIAMKFLDESWFEKYNTLSKGVGVPAEFETLRVNLNVKMDDGEVVAASYIGGFLKKGHTQNAETTMTAKESIVYAAVVLGDFKSALPAYFTKKIKVEGEQGALVKLATVRPTESQKTFYTELKKLLP